MSLNGPKHILSIDICRWWCACVYLQKPVGLKRVNMTKRHQDRHWGRFLNLYHHHVQSSHTYRAHWNPFHNTTSGPDSAIHACGCPKPHSGRPQALCKPPGILPSTLHTSHLPTYPQYPSKGPSSTQTPTYASKATSRPQPSLVLNLGDSNPNDHLDRSLNNSPNGHMHELGRDKIKFSAARYNRKRNLVLTPHHTTTQAQLNSVADDIKNFIKHLSDTHCYVGTVRKHILAYLRDYIYDLKL